MMHRDTLLAQAAELAEEAALASFLAIPRLAEILSAPRPNGTSETAWRIYRLEEAALAAVTWHAEEAAAGLSAWKEAVAFRWALVGLVEYRRSDEDRQGEAVLAAYHAACLYDWRRGQRFVTYAKFWMNRADRQWEAEMGGPVRVPRRQHSTGVRTVAEPLRLDCGDSRETGRRRTADPCNAHELRERCR